MLDEKIAPRKFINDQHLKDYELEMQDLFEMKHKYYDYGNPEYAAVQGTPIVGNVDWKLKIDEDNARKSSICELWTGKSSINEWNFVPIEFRRDDIDPDRVFILENFMIIRFMGPEGWKFLFLNLMTKKVFLKLGAELSSRIA